MSSCSEPRKALFSKIVTSEAWSNRFMRPGPGKRKVECSMFRSLFGLLRSWRRGQKQLSGPPPILEARAAERTSALEKANEDLKAAEAELQRRWQYLAEAQRLSHSGTFAWKVSSGELDWSDETYRILGFTREKNP